MYVPLLLMLKKKTYIPPAEYLYVSYVSKKETMKFFLYSIS